MGHIRLSLVAAFCAGICSISSADSLTEAFENGKVSGDITVTYEKRDQGKEISKYYSNTEYSVGSIGLYYKTATYNNFSLSVGFRAFGNIFEDDKNFVTNHGRGDSSERFYEEEANYILSNTYVAYDVDKLHIKVGRQQLYTESLTKLFNGITLYSNPIENMELELIHVTKRGREDTRNIRPVEDVNDNDGIYKGGLSYRFNDYVKAKAYYLDAPNSYNIIGGKINLDATFDSVKTGLLVHHVKASKDNISNKDEKLTQLKAYAKFYGYTTTLGFYKSGKESNLYGAIARTGDTFVPFEEGDQSYEKDAQTTYFQVSKSFGLSSLTVLYGVVEYGSYDSSELNIWAGHKFSDNLSLNLGYAKVDADSKDSNYTDLNQINTTLTYKF